MSTNVECLSLETESNILNRACSGNGTFPLDVQLKFANVW